MIICFVKELPNLTTSLSRLKTTFNMATSIEVPALGESVKQAILVKWHKADGEAVKADEPVCELETDKANVDVPAPASGTFRRVKDEGDTVNVGEVIARIEDGPAVTKETVKSAA